MEGLVIFSESRYTLPNGWNNDVEIATGIRNAEERRAAELAGYRVEFLGFPEPGVRPGYTQVTDIFSPDRPFESDPIWSEVDERLRELISGFTGLVIAPLGIGHHIDHRMVNASFRGALRDGASCAAGFYEDLPYAARFTSQQIRRLIPADFAGVPLMPVLLAQGNLTDKMRLLTVYESQLSEDDYDSVASHWDCRGRAELVWLRKESGAVESRGKR